MEHQQQVAIATSARANARISVVVAEDAYTTASGSVNGSFVVTALIQSNRKL